MKPLPAPDVPGNTDAERFDNAVRKVLTVSKTDLLKAEANWKRARARKKKVKKPTRLSRPCTPISAYRPEVDLSTILLLYFGQQVTHELGLRGPFQALQDK
jgi:hypothetical protein